MSDLQSQLDPTQVQVMDALLEAAGEDIRVAIPGIVQRVESTDPVRVTVLPAVHRHGITDKEPGIPGVPVRFPGSGSVRITWPVSVGDQGTLQVYDRELDGWIGKGGASEVRAQVPRTHDLADVVFVPDTIAELPTGAAGNFWLGGATVTSVLEGAAVKLGALAAQAVMRGNIFNAALTTGMTAIGVGFTAVGTFMAAVVNATSTWAGSSKDLAAVDVWITAVGAAAGTAGTAMGVAAGACTAFHSAGTTWLSTKVKTE